MKKVVLAIKGIVKYCHQIFSQIFIDKTISGGISGQIKLLAFIILAILILASLFVISFDINICPEKEKDSMPERLWILYNNFIDPGNLIAQNMLSSRIVIGVINIFGSVLLGGVLISTISNIIERRVEVVRKGKAYYKSIRDHYVIIGYSNIIISLIKEIHREDPTSVILIMSNKDSEEVRHKLQSQLNKNEEEQVFVYFGNIDSLEELGRLNINKAKEVYILGEEGDYGRDSKNIQCVHSISLLKGEFVEGKELPVYTQFNRLSTYSVIQKFDVIKGMHLQDEDNATPQFNNIYFRPFNIYENWARRLWSIYSIDGKSVYDTLDYKPICFSPDGNIINHDKYVHLVIVGFSGMGQALLLEAIRICHYANYDDSVDSEYRIRTKISIIDKNAEVLKHYFVSQIPNLDTQVDDIEISYINEDINTECVRNMLAEWADDGKQLVTIAICISDPDESINLGLNLPGEIYKTETRVLIRQEIQTDLGDIIHRDNGRYRNVKVFGMLEECISKVMLDDVIAAYVNQEYSDIFNSGCKPNEYIKNLYHYKINNELVNYRKEVARARKSWISLEENMRWANRYQIDAYITYLRTLGYSVVLSLKDGQKEITPEQFIEELSEEKLTALMRMEKHRWNAERTIEGWKYGKVRDDVHRIHPLIIPFNKITAKDKFKDKQVIVNLPYLLNLAGYRIIKN